MEVPHQRNGHLTHRQSIFTEFFVEVGAEGLNTKIKALSAYTGVMRPYPHPRSEEAIKGLAAYRGQAGCNYAEAFESVFFRT